HLEHEVRGCVAKAVAGFLFEGELFSGLRLLGVHVVRVWKSGNGSAVADAASGCSDGLHVRWIERDRARMRGFGGIILDAGASTARDNRVSFARMRPRCR